MNGWRGLNLLSHQSWLLATDFDQAATILLDCSCILNRKMVDSHVLVFMKVVDMDLNFKTRFGWPHFDISSSSYGQISGRWSDLARITFSTSKQNSKLLEAELGFGFNMKVVGLSLIFPSTKFQPNPTSRAPDIAQKLKQGWNPALSKNMISFSKS